MRIVPLLFLSLFTLFYSCLDEEELSVDALYSEELIEEFKIFDPCDTIRAPEYKVSRAAIIGEGIDRLFHLKYPIGEVLFIGRSLANNTDFDRRQLFYHGMTIDDFSNDHPTYVLFEDNTGVAGFDNVFLIAQQNSYDTNYLLGASSDGLRAAVGGDGDLFKINLYEIQEDNGNIGVSKFFILNATTGASRRAQYDYMQAGPPEPNSEEFRKIENFITSMKSGTYPFDALSQPKKFNLQLGLHQRDFKFAQGVIDEGFIDFLSEENQKAIETIARFSKVKTITALTCLTDQQDWTISDDLAANIRMPLD